MIVINIVIDTKLSSFKHFLSSFLSEFRSSQFHFNQYRNEGGGEKGESDG